MNNPSNAQTAAVRIHYRRLPDRTQVFEQRLVWDAGEYVVTLLESAPLTASVRAGDDIILEPGASVVWFTYPGRWYDIGRFHRADGTFTGVYANVLTPVEMRGDEWTTTDLCLDVWTGADGRVEILDVEEFEEAINRGWIGPEMARRARKQAEALAAAARVGSWPLPHVSYWTLARARARLENAG